MQAAKDTFYMTLCQRLAVLNPQRTATVDGVVRPAVLVTENERDNAPPEANETYCLQWGAPVRSQKSGRLLQMECTLQYATTGTDAMAYRDRGRRLGSMDLELAAMCFPSRARLCDWTQTPPADLQCMIFWSDPVLADATIDGLWLRRKSKVTVYYLAEAA